MGVLLMSCKSEKKGYCFEIAHMCINRTEITPPDRSICKNSNPSLNRQKQKQKVASYVLSGIKSLLLSPQHVVGGFLIPSFLIYDQSLSSSFSFCLLHKNRLQTNVIIWICPMLLTPSSKIFLQF